MIREANDANDANQEAGTAHPTAPPASDWDFCSIAELTKALQSRRISASELLEHTIARIEALDQRINAVIVRDFDRARTAAKAADVALARGERRPLLGIPATLKEPFNVAGLPTTRVFRSSGILYRTRMRSLSPG